MKLEVIFIAEVVTQFRLFGVVGLFFAFFLLLFLVSLFLLITLEVVSKIGFTNVESRVIAFGCIGDFNVRRDAGCLYGAAARCVLTGSGQLDAGGRLSAVK